MKYKRYLISALFIALIIYAFNKFLEFKIKDFIIFGDITYLNTREVDIAFVKFLRNQNLVFNDFEKFKSEVIYQNPEVKDIVLKNESLEIASLNFLTHEICCVIVDENKNKFLVNKEGEIIKKLNHKRNYPLEIPIDQTFGLDVKIDITMIEKINEIEKLFASNEENIADIKILGDSFEITTSTNKKLMLNLETSLSEFWEKYQTMTSHLTEQNKPFEVIDFRFDKVVVK